MAVPESEMRLTFEEYLAREREAESRHEYLDGFLYAMTGESPAHGIISVNLVGEISTRLRGGPCQPFTKDTKVLAGPAPENPRSTKGLFAYPDVVIVCGERKYHDKHQDVLLNPTVIIEILSETTKNFDRGEKFERYRSWLSTLAEYVAVHQTGPRIEHHRRQPTGQWLLTTIDGLETSLPLPALGCDLPLRDIYESVEFPALDEPAAESTSL